MKALVIVGRILLQVFFTSMAVTFDKNIFLHQFSMSPLWNIIVGVLLTIIAVGIWIINIKSLRQRLKK